MSPLTLSFSLFEGETVHTHQTGVKLQQACRHCRKAKQFQGHHSHVKAQVAPYQAGTCCESMSTDQALVELGCNQTIKSLIQCSAQENA